MLNPWKTSTDHEAVFIERYDRLLRWALGLTENDEQLAEDLVQDAFIQFTFNPPDLQSIHSIDGYLYGILRHLHLSHVRRAAQRHLQQFSIIDCDSAESSLRMLDPRDQIQVQEELRSVCQYACTRKESAKAASVLILRFFHGYYPSEIALLLRNSMQTVKVWLKTARTEARISLQNPQALTFINDTASVKVLPTGFARSPDNFLTELRQTIFRRRRGDCFSRAQMQELYREKASAALDCEQLAHLVSCEPCLTMANELLGLPPLSDRYPADTTGKEARKKKGGPGGGGAGGGGMMSGDLPKRYRRRAREVYEHYPQELCVSVNGYIQGTQRISSEVSDLTLTVGQEERISFVEVFSGQWTRLLLMNIDEQPPEGPAQQTANIKLSEDRTLEIRLKFSSPWPTLEMTYSDPTFIHEVAMKSLEEEVQSLKSKVLSPLVKSTGPIGRLRRWSDFGRWTLDFGLVLRPGMVTALFALLMIAALAILYRRVPEVPLTAVGLLEQATAAEEAVAARTEHVLRRTINLEEKRVTGELIARRKIEVWHSAEKGITARRLYDDDGALIAGDWRRADGVQTIYHHGARPQPQRTSESRANAPVSFDNVWEFELAAKEFASLIGNAQTASIQERANAYVISYPATDQDSRTRVRGLSKAELILSKSDLHAVEQTLVVQQGNETREYKFVEASFERRAPSGVAPAAFEPEPELLSDRMKDEGSRTKRDSSAGPALPVSPVPRAASAELELEVLKHLNQADALYGEQISLTRTPEGRLRVQGIVETEKRKGEILQALSSVKRNQAVQIQVETITEALARQVRQRAASSDPAEIDSVEVEAKSAIPAAPELRAYLSRQRGIPRETLDEEMRFFADRVIGRARQARRHGLALKQIAERFSTDDLSALDQDARNQWRSMISQHARAIQQELEVLGRELSPVFPSVLSWEGDAGIEIADDSDLAHAGKRLFELATSVDESVGRSFSIYADGNTSAPVKTNHFSRSLRSATSLAQRISRR